MQFEAICHEYEHIWSEIRARIQMKESITNHSLVLIGVTVGASQFFGKDPAIVAHLPEIYGLVAFLFLSLGLKHIQEDSQLIYLGWYSDAWLRPSLNHLLGESENEQIWRWNEWRARKQFSTENMWYQVPLAVAPQLVTYGPGIVFAVLYLRHHPLGLPPRSVSEMVSWLLAIFMILCTVISLRVAMFYKHLDRLPVGEHSERPPMTPTEEQEQTPDVFHLKQSPPSSESSRSENIPVEAKQETANESGQIEASRQKSRGGNGGEKSQQIKS